MNQIYFQRTKKIASERILFRWTNTHRSLLRVKSGFSCGTKGTHDEIMCLQALCKGLSKCYLLASTNTLKTNYLILQDLSKSYSKKGLLKMF